MESGLGAIFFDLAPMWTENFMAGEIMIYTSGVLSPKLIELLNIALDASYTHMYAPAHSVISKPRCGTARRSRKSSRCSSCVWSKASRHLISVCRFLLRNLPIVTEALQTYGIAKGRREANYCRLVDDRGLAS